MLGTASSKFTSFELTSSLVWKWCFFFDFREIQTEMINVNDSIGEAVAKALVKILY